MWKKHSLVVNVGYRHIGLRLNIAEKLKPCSTFCRNTTSSCRSMCWPITQKQAHISGGLPNSQSAEFLLFILRPSQRTIKIIATVITFQCATQWFLTHSVRNRWAEFWLLRSFPIRRSVTHRGLSGLYFIVSHYPEATRPHQCSPLHSSNAALISEHTLTVSRVAFQQDSPGFDFWPSGCP